MLLEGLDRTFGVIDAMIARGCQLVVKTFVCNGLDEFLGGFIIEALYYGVKNPALFNTS